MRTATFLVAMLFIAICAGSGDVAPALAQTEDHACMGDGIYLYEHEDFQGACLKFTTYHANLEALGFDNIASSIRFVGNFNPYLYRVTLCEHPGFSGTCSPTGTDEDNLGDSSIGHDRTSSLLVENPELYGDSLRIIAFNAQYFPNDWLSDQFIPDGCCEDIADRPKKFAERILAGNYDIVMLQEAFDDEIQGELTDSLKEYYPHFIEYIHDCDIGHQDSGLMLLSRLPFEPLLSSRYKADRDCLSASSGPGQDWRDVAYHEYANEEFLCYTCPPIIPTPPVVSPPTYPPYWHDACGGTDCLADKGIAFVRIRNPRTGQLYNLAFTHLQAASGLAQSHEIRTAQLGIIERVLRSQLNDDTLANSHLFLLGDLNINGIAQEDMDDEWSRAFDTPGSFFTDVLKDGWHFRQTALPADFRNFRDKGNTADSWAVYGTTKRLDYILYNYPALPDEQKLCIQHLSVAFNLRHGAPYTGGIFSDAGSNYITDHQGVNADINRWAERCSPDEAYVNPPFDEPIPGKITYPGSMQWYRIDPRIAQQDFSQNGTYSIYIEADPRIDFQVFQSDNLSSPLLRTASRSDTSTWTFTVPEQPIYVRVFSHDRTLQNIDYKLYVHRHEGTYQDEAIALLPNVPYLIDTAEHIRNQQRVWFRLDTEISDSGLPQTLQFFTEGDPQAIIQLVDKDRTTLDTGIGLIRPSVDTAGIYDNQHPLYMVVQFNTATRVSVGWITNLSVLHSSLEQPYHLRSEEGTEDDWFSNIDEIEAFKLTVDEQPTISLGRLGKIDDQQVRGMSDKIPVIKFLSKIHFEIIEDDDPLGSDDHMHGDIFPLASEFGVFRMYGKAVIRSDDGEFWLNYTMSRGFNTAYKREPFMVDLAVAIPSSLDSIVAGSVQTYTVSITNVGPGSATGAALAIDLPAGITLISAANSECNGNQGLVTCNIGVVSSGASTSIPLVLSTDPTIEERTTLPIAIQVDADQPDLSSDNDSSRADTSVVRRSDLSVSQALSAASVEAGAEVSYLIDVTNHGDSIATNVILTNDLPPEVEFLPSLSSPGCTLSAGVVTCELGLVLDSETRTVTISGQVASTVAEGTMLRNTVSVLGNETDPDIENNSSELSVNAISHMYMPLVQHHSNVDLVVKSLVATPEGIEVIIQNIGSTSAYVESGIWLDVYINPNPEPTSVNQTWQSIATAGLVWGRVLTNSELQPGDEITLRLTDGYFLASHSSYPDVLPAGTSIYAQVDSVNANTNYGAVLEGHEERGEAYNNISAITLDEPVSTANWQPLNASSVEQSDTFEIEVPRR